MNINRSSAYILHVPVQKYPSLAKQCSCQYSEPPAILTPGRNGRLDHEVSEVVASDLDDHHVLHHALHHHPQEGHQDQVVQQTRHYHAQAGGLHQLKADQEDEPGQQHGQGHVEDHLLGSALPPFPGYRTRLNSLWYRGK